jgi:hypothetical protein
MNHPLRLPPRVPVPLPIPPGTAPIASPDRAGSGLPVGSSRNLQGDRTKPLRDHRKSRIPRALSWILRTLWETNEANRKRGGGIGPGEAGGEVESWRVP